MSDPKPMLDPANYCREHDIFDCPYAHDPRKK